jgi:hypothetical protein
MIRTTFSFIRAAFGALALVVAGIVGVAVVLAGALLAVLMTAILGAKVPLLSLTRRRPKAAPAAQAARTAAERLFATR